LSLEDLEKSQKDLKFCKKMMYAFFFTSVFFCAGYIMESESFLWIEWTDHDLVEKNLIERGRADMFMDLYPSPHNTVKMLELGYLEWNLVPNNIKLLIDCDHIVSVIKNNSTDINCYYGGIEETKNVK
jgi:hypothetical protein